MSETTTITSGAAGRYAMALFELAEESGALEQTEADMKALGEALKDSKDLRTLISSPIYDRDEQSRGLAAVAEKMGLSKLVRNVAGLMGKKGRLHLMPEVIRTFDQLMAAHRGEVTAEVTSAAPLTDAQAERLSASLKSAEGKDVKLNVTVDDAIIGGLIVKVGSKMIDTSIRSKLAKLQNAMREAG